MDTKDIVGRYSAALAERKNWDSLWEEIADYVLPNRADFITQDRTVGDRHRTRYVFDSTAIHANDLLAAHLHGSLKNPNTEWFTLGFRSQEADKDAQVWLNDCANRMHDAFRESNFSSQANELYQDLCAFGTGCLFIPDRMDKLDKLVFQTQHMQSMVIFESEAGDVDTVMIEWRARARQALQRWPDAELKYVRDIADKDPDHKCRFLNVVRPAAEDEKITVGGMVK